MFGMAVVLVELDILISAIQSASIFINSWWLSARALDASSVHVMDTFSNSTLL